MVVSLPLPAFQADHLQCGSEVAYNPAYPMQSAFITAAIVYHEPGMS